MTRINCVPPEELHDKHLIAEYRELPRIFKAANRERLNKGGQPKNYKLGTGHVLFFYDKLGYLAKRQQKLITEMLNRGFKPKFNSTEDLWCMNSDKTLYGDWSPSANAKNINRARLIERINSWK
jgi:hypothetical protein